jgi:hypothetical protein
MRVRGLGIVLPGGGLISESRWVTRAGLGADDALGPLSIEVVSGTVADSGLFKVTTTSGERLDVKTVKSMFKSEASSDV